MPLDCGGQQVELQVDWRQLVGGGSLGPTCWTPALTYCMADERCILLTSWYNPHQMRCRALSLSF